MKVFRDLTGKHFGRLVVIGFAGHKPHNGHALWRVQCDCGSPPKLVTGPNLERATRSCGCLRREMMAAKMQLAHQIIGEAVKAAS